MLSMPRTRKAIRQQEAVAQMLKDALKARGVTRHSQRERLVRKAASSRPANLTEEAREAVANRRAIAMVERLGAGE